uniref:Uncharacterized protein n=1 Tax=Setaria italica TaxID=4555 RepID=K3YVT7_SETIT
MLRFIQSSIHRAKFPLIIVLRYLHLEPESSSFRASLHPHLDLTEIGCDGHRPQPARDALLVRHGVAVVVETLPLHVGQRGRRLALGVVLLHRRRRQRRLLLRGGEGVRGHDEPPDAGAHPVEDVAPAAPALAAERGDLLLVHLEVPREAGLLGQEPADAPLPPLPQGAAARGERGAERRRRLGAPERPLRRRGGDGLDLA